MGFDEKTLVGKTLLEVNGILKEQELIARIVSVNGLSRMVTMDVKMDRVNLTVDDGLVTKARRG